MLGCLALSGCGGGRSYEGPQRFAVTGMVKCNGTPIDAGTISFAPLDDQSGRLSGGPIVDGKYSVDESRGPTAGAYRVEVLWHKATGRKYPDPMGNGEMHDIRVQVLPSQFNQRSNLTAQVGEDSTEFDFDVSVPETEIDRALNAGKKGFRPE